MSVDTAAPLEPPRHDPVKAWVDEALSRAPEATEEQLAVIGRLLFGSRPEAAAS